MDRATLISLIELVEDARSRLRAGDESATSPIEGRYQEVLEALDWGIEQGRQGPADEAFRLASALVPFWVATKRIDEADTWFGRALERASAGEARRARAIYDHGYLVFWAGRYELAEARFADAIARAVALPDANLEALALAGSARVALNADPARAVQLLRRALDITSDLPGSEGRSSADHVLGVALQMSGDFAGARDVMLARLERARSGGNAFVESMESANLSMVERQLGNVERAEELARHALRIITRLGDQMAIPWVLNSLAAATAAAGRHDRAARLLGIAETLLARAGGEWPPDERAQRDGTLAALASAMTPEQLEGERATAASMSLDDGVAFALEEAR